jgi:hypothetical protein
MADICPVCWHEDCTCGTDLAEREAARRAKEAREVAKKIARERRGSN